MTRKNKDCYATDTETYFPDAIYRDKFEVESNVLPAFGETDTGECDSFIEDEDALGLGEEGVILGVEQTPAADLADLCDLIR